MAATAAALRLLRRRALLQPLFPRSYTEPRSLLLATAAAAAGLPDARRVHLSLLPAPSLLRHYTSKGCASPMPWQHRQGMQCPKQVIASSASILLDSHRVQLSLLPVPSLIRYYSSKGGVLPPPTQTTECQTMRSLKIYGLAIFMLILDWWMFSFYVDVKRCHTVTMKHLDKLKDLEKPCGMITEALKTFPRASNLLEAGFCDEAADLFHQGLDDCLKAIKLYEEVLEDFSKATEDCKELPHGDLEWSRKFCKENENFTKTMREKLNELSGLFETRKNLKQQKKWGLVDV